MYDWDLVYVPVRTAHVLHLTLTLVTLGLWAPIWLIVAIYNHGRTVAVWQRKSLHQYDDRAVYFEGWRWCTTHGTYEPGYAGPHGQGRVSQADESAASQGSTQP